MFLIVCAAFIAVPLVVSCIKGNPSVGIIAGLASSLLMGFAAGNGASMFEVHLIGFLLAGLAIAYSLHGD